MTDDSCYSDMLCFTNYIEFLSHDVGAREAGLANCYIISKVKLVKKLLYNVIMVKVLKIGIFVI